MYTREIDDKGTEPSVGYALGGLVETMTQNFECHRVHAAVRQRLFTEGDNLRIGRFRTIRRLGAGGMGEVYLCEDDALARRVAVKRVLGGGSAHAQEWLRREARALAKFSHDNIVQIHEIGEHEGHTFIAMEFVEGQTLGQWLRRGAVPWREAYERFMAAGRGLAAAHARGIVHRDFKPDNVLLGDEDGKIKVADFGLVLDQRANIDATGDREDEAMVGTVLYMAPEQLRGEGADARSDQFSFCLALYEGIWGESPFPARRVRERLRQLEGGVAATPTGERALFRVIRRGLDPDPARRWPSMETLLVALHRARHASTRRRRRAAAALAVAACVGLSLVVFKSSAEPALTCKTGLEGVWDPTVQTRFEHHIETLDASHVAASGDRMTASLDSWAAAWESEHAQLCELLSTPLDRVLERETSARAACLMRQSALVEGLVHGVEQGDARTLAAAVSATSQLPRPEDCAASLARLGVEPPPGAAAPVVETLRTDIQAARAQRLLGHLEIALAQARVVDRSARGLGYVPLEAEARTQLATVEDEAGHPLRAAALYDEAIHLAQVSHHDELVAELLIERVELSLHELRGDPSVHLRLELAETAQERVGANDRARARLAFVAGRLAEHGQDHARAEQRYTEAIALAGDEAAELPYYLGALAALTPARAQRLALRQRALELGQERFGPRHPRTALLLYNLGVETQSAGLDGEAELSLAAEIWVESLEPSHLLRAKAEQRFAEGALRRGELDLAERHALEAASILEDSLPVDHPERGEPEFILAQVAAMRADLGVDGREALRAEAIDHARRALRLLESVPHGFGPDVRVASLLRLVGNQLMSLGRLVEAEGVFERAFDYGGREGELAIISLRRAELALRRDELAKADRLLDSVAPHGSGLGAERPCYAVLRALVGLRLGQLSDARLDALRRARAEYPALDPALRAWLDELGVGQGERERLGFAAGEGERSP